MTEPLYIVLSLTALLAFDFLLVQPSAGKRYALWLSMAWIILSRPIGLTLWFGVIAGLAYSRRWKEIRWSPIALLPWTAVLWRNYTLTHQLTDYLSQWKVGWSYLRTDVLLVLDNVNRFLNLLLVQGLLALRLP